MTMQNLKLKNRKWDLVRRFEEREKTAFLKNLTIQEGFEIFFDLYNIASRSLTSRNLLIFMPSKLKTLFRIHSIFKKASLG